MNAIIEAQIDATLTSESGITGTLAGIAGISGSISLPDMVEGKYYDGDYEITPTEESQTLGSGGLTLRNAITINPIPSNYGRISYNGSVLTVT